MPRAIVPASFKATRRILTKDGSINAAPGDTVTPAAVAGLRNASALISRHWLIPLDAGGNPINAHGRKIAAKTPHPVQIGPSARKALAGG